MTCQIFPLVADDLADYFEASAPLPRRAPDPDKLSFVDWVEQVRPRFVWYRHARVIASVLQRVADGELSRVMIFTEPRIGKSEQVSRLFTAYYLYRYPERWVGLSSYAAALAYTLSRAARDNFKASGGTVRTDSDAVHHWETPEGGGMWAAGVGGPVTGKGGHLLVIDDPIKNAEEAASETVRESHREWYKSTFYTREEPDGAIILVQTRWNEDDLAGWLLAEETSEEAEEDGEPERWHIVSLPAIAEDAPPAIPKTCTLEPDWRKPGEACCPERHPLPKLRKIARRIGEYFWNALFQQRPSPPGGLIFDRANLLSIDALPTGCRFIRYWDKAGTEGGTGAESAGVLMAETREKSFIIVDVISGRWSALKREELILDTAKFDRSIYGAVTTWHEQEPGSGGKESAQSTNKNLAGYDVHAERVTGDKMTRARPFAAQVEAGNVRLLRGAWNHPYIEQLVAFPNGKLKDKVDASSGAFNKLSLAPIFKARIA